MKTRRAKTYAKATKNAPFKGYEFSAWCCAQWDSFAAHLGCTDFNGVASSLLPLIDTEAPERMDALQDAFDTWLENKFQDTP